MEDILTKLGAYVASKDSRLACAAAVILCEIAPRNSAVVRALIAGLEQPDPVRRPYIIEALGRIGTPEAAAALVPLIKSEGPNSEHALRAIAHTASAALKPLLQLIGSVPPALLERIAECAARTGEAVALSSLLGHLTNADVEVCRAIRGGLRTAMSSFDQKAQEHLRKQLEKAFHDKTLTQHPSSLIALLKISGDLGDPSLQRQIVDRTDDEQPVNVRRAALQALALLHITPEQRGRLASRLLPLMQESDVANLGEPALEALRQAQLGAESQGQLRKLLNSPSSRIREFAMQALAAQGSARTLSELIGCLDSPDRSVREEALGALSRAPSAAGALCERLLELNGGEAAMATARALAAQAANIPRRLLIQLAEQYVSTGERKKADADSIRKAEEKSRAIIHVFRATSSSELVDAVFAHAARLRQKDEPLKAHDLLRGVIGLPGWGDEQRIELALAGLMTGARDLSRAARSGDANLQALQEVLYTGRKNPKEMSRRLLKDSGLSRKVLHYIGFHFVERMNTDREFGRLLLESLAETRSEEGRQAKEKLVLEGLATMKGGKNAILEERARVLLAASDMVAADSAREERRAQKASHNGKAAAKPQVRSKLARKPAKRKAASRR